jgi:hypothetical protein
MMKVCSSTLPLCGGIEKDFPPVHELIPLWNHTLFFFNVRIKIYKKGLKGVKRGKNKKMEL